MDKEARKKTGLTEDDRTLVLKTRLGQKKPYAEFFVENFQPLVRYVTGRVPPEVDAEGVAIDSLAKLYDQILRDAHRKDLSLRQQLYRIADGIRSNKMRGERRKLDRHGAYGTYFETTRTGESQESGMEAVVDAKIEMRDRDFLEGCTGTNDVTVTWVNEYLERKGRPPILLRRRGKSIFFFRMKNDREVDVARLCQLRIGWWSLAVPDRRSWAVDMVGSLHLSFEGFLRLA